MADIHYSAAGGAGEALQEILARKRAEQQQSFVNSITTAKTQSDIAAQRDQMETNRMYRTAEADRLNQQALAQWASMHDADTDLTPEGISFLKAHGGNDLIVPEHDETITSQIGVPQPKTPSPYANAQDPGFSAEPPLAPAEPPPASTTGKHIGAKFAGLPAQRDQIRSHRALTALMQDPEFAKQDPLHQWLSIQAITKENVPSELLKKPGHLYVIGHNGQITTGPETERDMEVQQNYPPQPNAASQPQFMQWKDAQGNEHSGWVPVGGTRATEIPNPADLAAQKATADAAAYNKWLGKISGSPKTFGSVDKAPTVPIMEPPNGAPHKGNFADPRAAGSKAPTNVSQKDREDMLILTQKSDVLTDGTPSNKMWKTKANQIISAYPSATPGLKRTVTNIVNNPEYRSQPVATILQHLNDFAVKQGQPPMSQQERDTLTDILSNVLPGQ